MGFVDIALLVGVGLAAALAGWLFASYRALRRGARGHRDLRRLARLLLERRLRRGRPAFMRLFPGVWMHLVPEGRDVEAAVKSGAALAAREAKGRPLIRFTLADLKSARHPSAGAFEALLPLGELAVTPERVLFTASTHLVRTNVAAVFVAQGLETSATEPFEPSPDDPFGELCVGHDGFDETVSIADLVAEAVSTLTPLDTVTEDRAVTLLARTQLYREFVAVAKEAVGEARVTLEGRAVVLTPEDGAPSRLDYRRLAMGLAGGRARWKAYIDEHLRGISARRGEDIEGHVLVTEPSEMLRHQCVALITRDAAQIATTPALLAGALHAAEQFGAGTKVRLFARSTGVLVVAQEDAPDEVVGAWLHAGWRVGRALGFEFDESHVVDEIVTLSEKRSGQFIWFMVESAFFVASVKEQSARLEGNFAGAAEARGLMRLALGDPEGARLHLSQSVRRAPDVTMPRLLLGALYNEREAFREAEEVLRPAVVLAPGDGAVNNALGVAYQGLGRLEEASLCYEKAMELMADDPVVRVNLGRLAHRRGQPQEAEGHYQDALRRDEGCVPALAGMVQVAVDAEDLELARARVDEALAKAPEDPVLLRLHRALHPDEPVH